MTTPQLARPAPHEQQHLQALYTGLVLTVLLALAPLVDVLTVDSIAGHVRATYPEWTVAEVAAERTAIAGYLAGVGALAALGWLGAVWAARGRGARTVTTALFAVGTLVALVNLGVDGAAYDRIIPLGYGLAGLLPCLAGLTAVLTVWRRGTR